MQSFLGEDGLRLDVFLSKKLNQSRNQIQNLIKNNLVKINDKIEIKTSIKLNKDDVIEVSKASIKEKNINIEVDFDIEVLFEDDDILVLNKPSNLVVHGASSVKEATLVDWLIKKNYTLSNLNGDIRAGLVHRLDKGTSGAIIIAKNNHAHEKLSNQLLDKSMGRFYLAFINLPIKNENIVVEKAIIRAPNNRIKKLAINELEKNGAKYAKSAFANLLCKNDVNLIAAKLFTGRTHQIRAHLASINRYILGDNLYGYSGKEYGRVMLHAYFVYFIHPKTQEKIFIKAPLNNEFDKILLKEFDLGEINEKLSLEYIISVFDSFI